jgi:alpha-beta hydrolase superfamily lysophospholipase
LPTEIRWVDSADGTRLRVVVENDAGRDLLVVPGLAEHAGRYAHVTRALPGWRVHVLELRGHGHSGGKRGHVMRWGEYVEDVKAAARDLRPGWALVSHSMGGLVSLSAVLEGLAPKKLLLSNPLLGVKVQAPRLKVAAGKLLSRIFPGLSLYNELKPEWLSRDPKVGEAYKTDDLVYDTITPRWYTEMLAAQGRALAGTYTTPLAMFVGDADAITDPAVNLAFAERTRAAVKVYPEHRHEIFNEIGKEKVLADVAEWLDA